MPINVAQKKKMLGPEQILEALHKKQSLISQYEIVSCAYLS